MTDPDIDTTVAAPADVPPMSSEKAAEVVENEPALQEAAADQPNESDES